jgi:hypothetical protein
MWLRGQKARALDYAAAGLKDKTFFKQSVFAILLNCLKGLPPADVLGFLNKVFDLEDPEFMTLIKDGLIHEGCKPLFLYYQKKLIDAGRATKGDYLYLLLAAGKYQQALTNALSWAAADPAAAGETLLLCRICGGRGPEGEADETETPGGEAGKHSRPGGSDEAEGSGPYDKYAGAFFRNRPLSSLAAEDLPVLERFYPLIAFAKDNAWADRFAAVFQQDQKTCFLVKAAWCLSNELYDELLKEDIPAGCEEDPAVQLCRAQCCLALRKQEQAFAILESLLLARQFSERLFNLLLLLAQQSPPPLSAQAFALHEQHRQSYDADIDSRDIANTGLRPD